MGIGLYMINSQAGKSAWAALAIAMGVLGWTARELSGRAGGAFWAHPVQLAADTADAARVMKA